MKWAPRRKRPHTEKTSWTLFKQDKLQRNEIFEAAPAEVHFAGFEVDQDVKSYEQILRIINISGQIQRMTVLPPKTKFFDVLYVKPVKKTNALFLFFLFKLPYKNTNLNL